MLKNHCEYYKYAKDCGAFLTFAYRICTNEWPLTKNFAKNFHPILGWNG